jgi:hypothetical protein
MKDGSSDSLRNWQVILSRPSMVAMSMVASRSSYTVSEVLCIKGLNELLQVINAGRSRIPPQSSASRRWPLPGIV